MNRHFISSLVLLLLAGSGCLAAEGTSGLLGRYYDNKNFTGPSIQRVDPVVSFAWGGGAPAPEIAADTFSVIWTGGITPPTTGVYEFQTYSDDGVQLIIDGKIIIDNWTDHGAITNAARVNLTAGLRHEVILSYYENGGDAVIKFRWIPPGGALSDVPAAVLDPILPTGHVGAGTGLTASIYDTTDFTGTPIVRQDSAINFNWDTGSPIAGIGADTFSCVWKGYLEPRFTDMFTIYTFSDDGVRLYLDDKLLIDNWTNHAVTTNQTSIFLVAGRKYEIRIEYYENTGKAVMQLYWSSPLIEKEIIPQTALYPYSPAGAVALRIPARLDSYVNPAWVESEFDARGVVLNATKSGTSLGVIHEGSRGWYLNESSAETPGVLLNSDSDTIIQLHSRLPDVSDEKSLTLRWIPLDLSNLAYGTDSISLRPNDKLRLSAGATSGTCQIDYDYGSTFSSDIELAAGADCVVSYATPGRRVIAVRSKSTGAILGRLTVSVPSLNFLGPIACEIGYQRAKDITVANCDGVSFEPNDQSGMAIVSQPATGTTQRLFLRPLARGALTLQARLGERGPLLQEVPIDEFTIETSARRYTTILREFQDGSCLTEAFLEINPLVANLDVELKTYIAGVTFGDSSTKLRTSTNNFTPTGATGTWRYELIKAPASYAGVCHTISVFQNNVRISR